MSVLDKVLHLEYNGFIWEIPVKSIAENRADSYKDEFGDDLKRSLQEDTLPLFEDDEGEIFDWVQNNMNPSDLLGFEKLIKSPTPSLDDAWFNGEFKDFLHDASLPNSDNEVKM